MKKLIFIILLTSLTLAQTGKSVLTQAQKDSIATLPTIVNIASEQTITGHKAFNGNISLGRSSAYGNTITFNPYYDHSSNWSLYTSEDTTLNGYKDTIPIWTVLNLGYNVDNLNTGDVRSWLAIENNYWINNATPGDPRSYATEIYFAWTDTNDVSNQIRPFNIDIRKGTGNSQVGVAAEEFYVTDRTRKNWFIMQPDRDIIYAADTMDFWYLINNDVLFKQSDTTGWYKGLFYIDDSNRFVISPDGIDTYFPYSITGSLKLENQAGVAVPIYNDTTKGIRIEGKIFPDNIGVVGLPQDTVDLAEGDLYIDPNTNSVMSVLGENLITNGDFTTWTDSVPDNWTSVNYDGTNQYTEQSPAGALHLYTDGLVNANFQSNVNMTIGVDYGYSFNIISLVDSVQFYIAGNALYCNKAGRYSGEFTGVNGGTLFQFVATNPPGDAGRETDVTIDNIRVWEIGSTKQAPAFDLSKLLSGSDSFTTSAIADTISNTTITSSDVFIVSINDATPVADDLLSWTAETGRLIVHRPAGTTSNLAYSYMRIK